jgi:hypothetical protein
MERISSVPGASRSLSRAVLPPRRRLSGWWWRVGLVALLGVLALAGLARRQVASSHAILAVSRPVALPPVHRFAPAESPRLTPVAPVPRPESELALSVPLAGATYVVLATAPDELPEAQPRSSFRLVREAGGRHAVLAPLAAEQLPAGAAGWRDAVVQLEGGCTARIAGFHLIGLLESPEALAAPAEGPRALLALVRDSVQLVVAARLDGCTGVAAGAVARRGDGSGPRALAPVSSYRGPAGEAMAAHAVLAAVLAADEAGKAAQRRWRAEGRSGAWLAGAELHVEVFHQPGSQRQLASVHAHLDEGCGGVEINEWALFELGGAAPRPLARRSFHHDGGGPHIESLERVVALDDGGQLGLVATDNLGFDRVLLDPEGAELRRLPVAFYGCGC